MDIFIFALIAGFLVYRLYGVLGRRHGEERQRPNPFGPDRTGQPVPDNVIPLPDRTRNVDSVQRPDEPFSLSAGIAQIRQVDAAFEEKRFLQGAKAAFQMIVDAYARGDIATLRPLLRDDVYESFAAEIRRRLATGEQHQTVIERIRDIDLLEARLNGRMAEVTVKIVSDQINATKNAAGQVIDGDAERVFEVTDIWTFARNTRTADPNWLLIETRTSN